MLYLQKRNQTYYFRIHIPHDIAHWFEVSEIKQSLRIKSHLEAKRFASNESTPTRRQHKYNLSNSDSIKVGEYILQITEATNSNMKYRVIGVCWELFNLILDVASGRKQAAAECLGLYNDLVLFNPAPIT